MDILEQCRQWNESGAFEKSREMLEAIPAEERGPEGDAELAEAYLALAETEGTELYHKALRVLAVHEEAQSEDFRRNRLTALAYYYLDEEGLALYYFECALYLHPEDKEVREYVDDCRERLTFPRFEKNFRERTKEAWAAFLAIEAELRAAIDRNEDDGEAMLQRCGAVLEQAIRDVSFELGFDGEKYELILCAEGRRSALYPLVYFCRRAPKEVLAHWKIRAGSAPNDKFALQQDTVQIDAADVDVWLIPTGEQLFSPKLYCEKLLPLQRENPRRAEWMLYKLTNQILGDIAAIAFLTGIELLEAPEDSEAKKLSDLYAYLGELGYPLWEDAAAYLDTSEIAYRLDADENPDADWRLDVYEGSTRLSAAINEYLHGESDLVDEYHRNGIVPGFLLYPLSTFPEEGREEALAAFRDELRAYLSEHGGEDALCHTGFASGLYYGYLDFIAWDLESVLDAALAFFKERGMTGAEFHSFRRNVGGITLFRAEPKRYEETGSLLSPKDIETLEAFLEDDGGYYGKMVRWIEQFVDAGAAAGRFSKKQARRDLKLSLYYGLACNNFGEYSYYYRGQMWMKDAEENAKGSGVWYYRYAVGLLYSGYPEEALRYAEQGVLEEAGYPWTYLLLGKLRAAFGDKEGARAAAEQGLKLEPGDYEFLTLKREVEEGASLEAMLYHWIDPEADRALQEGRDEDGPEKKRAIACIRKDEAGLRDFYELFRPEEHEYTKDAPFCEFYYPVGDRAVKLCFRMNEAGLSKLGHSYLAALKEKLDSGSLISAESEEGGAGKLEAVLVQQTGQLALFYRRPGSRQYFTVEDDSLDDKIDAALR